MSAHRVLVVDDDNDIRETIRDILLGEGYGVATAKNGRDALDVLDTMAAELPCLILLDLLMPVMNGVELLEHRKGDARLAHIPVIVVSAGSMAKPPEGTVVMRKPVQLGLLLDAVKQHC